MTLPENPTPGILVARRVSRLVDAVVRADFVPHYSHTPEARAQFLEQSVKEFHDHIRDHRSLDSLRMAVERIYEDQCSLCGHRWETYEEDVTSCAYCGVPTE